MLGRPFRVSSPILLAPLLLGACASQGQFPSLAPRAVERDLTGGSAPVGCPDGSIQPGAASGAPETPPLPVNPDPQLGTRVAGLLTAARAGQAAFAEALPRASAGAARAGAAGSESWIAAQQEISRLEAARTRTVDALAELDALAVRRSDAPVTEADYQRRVSAAEEVRALAQTQQAELDRLAGLISEP
jgi:hypothetical protein